MGRPWVSILLSHPSLSDEGFELCSELSKPLSLTFVKPGFGLFAFEPCRWIGPGKEWVTSKTMDEYNTIGLSANPKDCPAEVVRQCAHSLDYRLYTFRLVDDVKPRKVFERFHPCCRGMGQGRAIVPENGRISVTEGILTRVILVVCVHFER